ncbi:hypothetical protein I305_04793 [Cryptococcus gattii E566]|nr:hypothetical protein I305_04793 [Cryptococcus gattii E566]KJE01516.1 hypothetical protein I311_04801 [Cryptococcus gattii NT-10]
MSVPDAPASLLGKGWTHLSSFDDLDDDEYEPEEPGILRPKDESIPAATSGHESSISEQAKGQGIEGGVEVGMSGISRSGSVSVSVSGAGAGAVAGGGGPSTLFAGATPRPGAGGKRGNKTRRVIEHPDELNTFDLDAMGPHQSGTSVSISVSLLPVDIDFPLTSLVELGPRVMESLGLTLSSDGQGVLLTKKEMENVLLGVPVTGKKGRPKKPHYLGED